MTKVVHVHLDGVTLIKQNRTSEGTFGRKKGEGEGLSTDEADETFTSDRVIVVKRKRRKK